MSSKGLEFMSGLFPYINSRFLDFSECSYYPFLLPMEGHYISQNFQHLLLSQYVSSKTLAGFVTYHI